MIRRHLFLLIFYTRKDRKGQQKVEQTGKKSKEMDMLNGGLAGKLILFSIPLAFSSILQQLFNSADVAVVGRFAGDQALAAVGSCVALVGIFVNLIVGLAVGPNAALANLIGQKNRGKINSMVHTILTFGAVLRISLMVIGMLVARVILEASDVLPDRVRMFTSYEMLMNVYVASWLFTGGSMFVIYFRHMKGLERQFMGNQG